MKQKQQISNRTKQHYESVAAFREHLASVSRNKSRLTFEVDKLISANSYTLQEIMSKIETLKNSTFTDSNDFANIHILKKHIRYRASHNNMKFKLDQYNNLLLLSIEADSQSIDF